MREREMASIELRTRDKILLHLLESEVSLEKRIVSATITQRGIEVETGLNISSVSDLLGRLEGEGLVKREKKKIIDKDRQWAYFLTEDGISRALLIKRSLEESPVDTKLLELTSKKRKSVKPKNLLAEYKEALELVEKEKTGKEKYRLKLNIMSEIVKLYFELRDTGQAMNTSLNILKLSLEAKDRKGEAQARFYIGKVQEIRNEWENAKANFLEAYALSDGLDDLLTAEVGRHLGRIYWRMSKFDEAVFYYEKCLNRLKGTKNNKNGLASLYIDLGLVYGDMGDMDRAIDYYNKSLELSKETKNRHESIRAQHNIGYAYQIIEDYDKAQGYYENCLKLAIESDSAEDIGHAYINAGYCFAKLKKTRKALEYTKKGLEIFELSNDLNMVGGAQRNYGMIYASKNQWKKSKEHFEKSIDILEKINMPHHLAWTYLDYGLTLKSKGDKKWKDFLKKALKIYDELNSVKDIEKVKKALKKKS